jgi:DNA-binding NarL/FixJ family response regulator
MFVTSSPATAERTVRSPRPALYLVKPSRTLRGGNGPGIATIGVVIADGQALVRAGLSALLDDVGDVTVLGDAENATRAVAIARKVRPDVLLLDADLPGLGCAAATQRILADPGLAGVHIVMLAAEPAPEDVFAALRAGASGFLLKDTEPAALVEAVRAVAAGGAALAPCIAQRVVSEFTALADTGRPCPADLDELTPRELEVVRLVALGLRNREIAEHLAMSQATTKTHVGRALRKLGARDRAELVTIAYETGLVVGRRGRAGAPASVSAATRARPAAPATPREAACRA